MHITQLKLLGFKSFVEPTDLIIRPGLTGVVGPNGCGKSNLLEALRWVMGETSYKAMRGSGMDDVIFSGTQLRPSRNNAEVSIQIDNTARTAPAEFNEEDLLEISRVIQRGEGSSYKVNGRDVRAKDIKLLFEDAATGARSHALVRQGQIGEIVNSKPEARRRILEDAAGIAGLYSRRHEAELRLSAAEGNLERLADIMGQMDAQLNSLKRQARHAIRYKEISQKLRNFEALAMHLTWSDVKAAVAKAEDDLGKVQEEVNEGTLTETKALTMREQLTEALRPLREKEAETAAALHRLNVQRDGLQEAEEQAKKRKRELQSNLSDAKADLIRDEQFISEGEEIANRLAGDIEALSQKTSNLSAAIIEAKAVLEQRSSDHAACEERLNLVSQNRADVFAQSESLKVDISRQQQRADQCENQLHSHSQEKTLLQERLSHTEVPDYGQLILELETAIEKKEQAFLKEEADLSSHQQALQETTNRQNETALALRSLQTEIALLEKLVKPHKEHDEIILLDQIETKAGYEQALWAALGDDLDVPLKSGTGSFDFTSFWKELDGGNDAEKIATDLLPPLPSGCVPLSDFVKGPQALERRFAFVGVADEADAERLQGDLSPGQCLVSKSGGLWRWDGFVVLPDAPTSAPQRLTERNRLPQLIEDLAQLDETSTKAEAALALLTTKKQEAEAALKKTRSLLNSDQEQLKHLNQKLRQHEQTMLQSHGRLAALDEAIENASSGMRETAEIIESQQKLLTSLPDMNKLETDYQALKDTTAQSRALHNEAQLNWAGLQREEELNQARLQDLSSEKEGWLSRASEAKKHILELQQRIDKILEELKPYSDLPAQYSEQRQALFEQISLAETARSQAGDALAEAETATKTHDHTLRTLQNDLIKWREEKARVETRLEGNKSKLADLTQRIELELRIKPEGCLALSGFEAAIQLPPLLDVKADITRLTSEREKIGAVNLMAEDEIRELEEQFGGMLSEREDLEVAVQKLRSGVNRLNEEGRQRLLKAFDEVNGHFKRLFQTLFAGGEAELQLISSDDPLESGLEILARPPGKKPQVLTLLSGGEKALTAMSLIFAVFLTNPSPICVLDEVDAPLDDSNVDRFCLMMEEMSRMTDTRFLVITHHPMTMERMDRLFGVTMSEKGVSQLVSVDLATAEGLLETA